MIYQYDDLKTGGLVEIEKSMSDADEIGSVIEHEGRRLRRRPPIPQVNAGMEGHSIHDYRRFKSVTLPRWYKYHGMAGGTYDAQGNCLVEGERMIRETKAIARAHGDNLEYDSDAQAAPNPDTERPKARPLPSMTAPRSSRGLFGVLTDPSPTDE